MVLRLLWLQKGMFWMIENDIFHNFPHCEVANLKHSLGNQVKAFQIENFVMSTWKVLKLHAGQKRTFLAFENDTFFFFVLKYWSDDIETNIWVSKATLSKLCKLNICHEKIALKLTFGKNVQAFENSSFCFFCKFLSDKFENVV